MGKLKVAVISVSVLAFWNVFKKSFWNIAGPLLLKQGTDFNTLNYNSNMYGYVDAAIIFGVVYYILNSFLSKTKDKENKKADDAPLPTDVDAKEDDVSLSKDEGNEKEDDVSVFKKTEKDVEIDTGLTKGKRAAILFSLIYIVFSYLIMDMDFSYKKDVIIFLIYTVPVWGYWGGVWVFGFGWLLKLWRKIRKFIYVLLFVAIVGVYAFQINKDAWLWADDIALEPVNIPVAGEKKPLNNDEWGEWEPVNIRVTEERQENAAADDDDVIEWEDVVIPVTEEKYKNMPEALEDELRRIKMINSY